MRFASIFGTAVREGHSPGSRVGGLDGIYDWIVRDSPANAASVVERILDSIENTLALFPFMGRAGAVTGTREWVVPGLPYLAVYEIVGDREALS